MYVHDELFNPNQEYNVTVTLNEVDNKIKYSFESQIKFFKNI
jgi:hypothetical protein